MIIEEKITFDKFIRWSLTALVVIVVLLLMNYLSSVLLPFFVAWLLAYLVYPVVKFVQYKMHVPTRVLSIIVSLIFIVAVIVGIFYLIIPPMVDQFDKLSEVLSRYLHEKTHIDNFPATIQQWINEHKIDIQEFFRQEDVTEAIRNAMPKVFSVIGKTASVVVSIAASLITLLYLFFILLDYEKLASGFIKIFPQKSMPAILGPIFTDKYSSSRYESFLKRLYGERRMDELMVPTAIISYRTDNGTIFPITSWNTGDFPIWEAARARWRRQAPR